MFRFTTQEQTANILGGQMSRAETEVPSSLCRLENAFEIPSKCFPSSEPDEIWTLQVRVMGEKKEALQTEWEEVRYLGQVGILSLTAEFIVISYCASTKYLRQYWHQYPVSSTNTNMSISTSIISHCMACFSGRGHGCEGADGGVNPGPGGCVRKGGQG